jgi:hypothetical protein
MTRSGSHTICGRKGGYGMGEDFCIRHSGNPEKDKKDFYDAFAEHHRANCDFRYCIYGSRTWICRASPQPRFVSCRIRRYVAL